MELELTEPGAAAEAAGVDVYEAAVKGMVGVEEAAGAVAIEEEAVDVEGVGGSHGFSILGWQISHQKKGLS